MKRLKQLPKGVKRLLLTISILIALIVLFFAFLFVSTTEGASTGVTVLLYLSCIVWPLGTFIVFWIITRLILWIVDGFKE